MTPPPPSDRRRPRRRATSPRKPAQPAKPSAAKPARAAKPAQPAKPAAAKPAKPGQPVKPAGAKPAKPARAAKPAQAAKPAAAKPARAAKPGAGPAKAPQRVPAAEPEGALVGQTVGRCKLLERIGIGRTAVVYRALYEPLDQEVAVKILLAETAAMPELVERFHSEAKAIAKIDNENVLKIYDVGTQDEHHYMVVELLEGEEILDLIQREGQVDPTDALRILRQAANGLSAAHAKGIIHRDIKPQNLFLLEDGTVKVVDFGLAAAYDDSTERVGTPHYMAPEVCETGVADLGSDVYALGIVLYHLLVGQPPYAGQRLQEILKSHVNGVPLRPEMKRMGLPKEVGELVRTLTKRDPLLRPTSADTVEQLDGIGGQALKEKDSLKGRRRRRSRSRAAVARRDRKEAQKSPLPIVLAAVGLVVIVGGVVALMRGGDKPKAPPATQADTQPTGTGDPADKDDDNPTTDADAEALALLEREREAEREVAEREKLGREALARAKAYARETWKDRDDTDAVIQRYRMVARSHKKTEAASEAKRIVREIKDGKVHPHPDRSWSSSQDLADARNRWTEAQPKVEALIAKRDYRGARKLVPVAMDDPSGKFGREIRFWTRYTDELQKFRTTLSKGVREAMETGEKFTIDYEGAEVPIERVTDIEVTIVVNGKRKKLAWATFEPAAMATLAEEVMADTGTEALVLQMAHAFAHRLENAFWSRELDISSASDAKTYADWVREYTERYEAR